MKKTNKQNSLVLLLCFLLSISGGMVAFAEGVEYSHLIVNFVLQDGTGITEPYTGNFEPAKTYDPETIAIPSFPTYTGYMPSLPKAPSAQGLVFDFSAADYKFTYSFDGTQAAGNIMVDIVFLPIVNVYKAEYYHQSLVDSTQYEKVATETFSGMTGSTVDTEAITARHSADGFAMRNFNAPTVAADGSTVVRVFYDRAYYLLSFEPNGAVETAAAQYLPYGTTISAVSNPTRPGYTFTGWSPAIPSTMPAQNTTCTAQWNLTSPNANVSIVAWGENANDDNYAYLATSIVSAPVDSTYTINPSTLTVYACGKPEHAHNTGTCVYCSRPEHTHTADCLDCPHVNGNHDVTCYGATSTTTSSPDSSYISVFSGLNGGLVSGRIYRRESSYWLYYDNEWYPSSSDAINGNAIDSKTETWLVIFTTTYYVYNAKSVNDLCKHLKTNPTHNASCYGCGLEAHTHSSACCTMEAHTHNNSCKIDTSLYTINSTKTQTSTTVKADGSSVLNVYYDRKEFTITMNYNYSSSKYNTTEYIREKWGANIANQWSDITSRATNAMWSTSTGGGSPYTSLKQVMPSSNQTFYMRNTSGTTYTGGYYLQSLNDESVYELMALVPIKKSGGSVTMTSEDKIDITGFTYSSGYSYGGAWNGAQLKYTRNSYNLILNDGVSNFSTLSVKYETPLSNVSALTAYTEDNPPQRPATIPSAYIFDGWSLSPDGGSAPTELNTITMPTSQLILYARWKAPEYTIEIQIDETTSIEMLMVYGNKIEGLETPTREGYEFVGWFYLDGEGVEHAFNTETMYVHDDIVSFYAKWRNVKEGTYTVNFVEKNNASHVLADPQIGTALYDTTFTVTPKQISGYFPTLSDKSITMTEDESNAVTFEYIEVKNVPYMVKYEDESGNTVATTKTVNTNSLDVVTERYVPVTDYIVDEVYKTRYLVVDSADPLPEDNVITFVYTRNETDIMVTVEYYTNTDLTGEAPAYSLFDYTQELKTYVAGGAVTATPIDINNFTFNADISSPTTQYMADTKQDMVFTFKYEPNVVTVTYRDGVTEGDVGVLQRSRVLPGGRTPAYVSAEPVHPTEPDKYVFDGWDKEIATTVTEDTTYNALWTGVFHVHHCTGAAPSAKDDVVEDIRVDAISKDGFNITEAIENETKYYGYKGITEGCVYGGLWSDASGSALRNDVCGLELKPTDGTHYYVREISNGYLTPKTLTVRIKGVYSCALVSAIDDPANYIGFGFDVTVSGSEKAVVTSSSAFDKLVVKYADKKKADSEYTADDVFKGLTGKMICYDAPSGEGEQSLSFTPFFATKDSVKVYGTQTRTLTYSSTADSSKADSPSLLSCEKYVPMVGGSYVVDDDNETMRLSMVSAPSFVLGSGDENASVDVTINIGELHTTVSVPVGTDLSDSITNPSVAGSVFAGWFRDEACTRPANLSCVTEDMEIHAGFMDDGYLQVAELPAATASDVTRIRLVSAIDAAFISSCGFVVSDENGSREIEVTGFYDSIDGYTAAELFEGTDEFASLICHSISLANQESGKEITVTPYWIPLTGAKVMGSAKRIVFNGK